MPPNYSVSVRVTDTSGRVLFVRRSAHAGSRVGQLEHPAGRIALGERPSDAALRELTEETGILLPPHRLFPLGIEDGPKGRHYVYSARVLRGTLITLSREHDEALWLLPQQQVAAHQDHEPAGCPLPRRDVAQGAPLHLSPSPT